jgi:hypothetical protein
MSKKLTLKFNQSNFLTFLEKFSDLTHIDDVVKLKIDQEEILMYSIISNEVTVLALKNYVLNTKDFIENFQEEETFDFIITSATKFSKNLKFFNTTQPIKLDLISKKSPDDDTVQHVRTAQFTNGKLKISTIAGEQYRIRDLTKSVLNAKLNPKLSKWNFKVSQDDFNNIKKLSTINNEDKTFNISVDKGIVTFQEPSKWELEVSQIEPYNATIIFSKKYLGNIDSEKEFINFNIFDNFILIKDEESNLMLSFEQDFTNED